MGTWGTFVVARDRPAGEIAETVDLLDGWRRFLLNDLHAAGGDQIASTVGSSPAILAHVADSDYCRVVGVSTGEVQWVWTFGEAPWDPAPGTGEAADPESITLRAREVSEQIAAWAGRAGLRPGAADAMPDVLDRGYVFAEEGLLALLQAVGLAPGVSDDPGCVAQGGREAGVHRPIHIWNTPNRWVLLQINTTADLYDHLGAVVSWLDQARQELLVPLVASYNPALVATSIGPNESIRGAPNGLLVRSSGWSQKNRPVFGGGDDTGWNRKLRQLSRRELREINLTATAFGPSGHWRDGAGEIAVAAVLRDQFTRQTPAPLPADHPGQLKAWFRAGLLERIPGVDTEVTLRQLGEVAVNAIPEAHAFLELERPLSGHQEVVPVSPLAWTSHPGVVEFRPDSVTYSDPPRRSP